MNQYTVLANDDAMKYQVIRERKGKQTVLFEHDAQDEAEYVRALLHEAYVQGATEPK